MSKAVFGIIALTAAISQVKEPKTFLWDMMIGKETTEKEIRFEIHTKNAGRYRAPLVGRRENSILVERESFQVQVVEPAMIKIHTVNEAENMFTQQFGQTIYQSAEKAWKQQLAKDMTKLKEVGFRTKVWMLANFVKTGVCPMGEGDKGVSYGEFKKEVLSGTDLFTDPSADIIAILEKRQMEIQQKTGIVVDTVITTPKVAAAILNNPKIKEYLKETNANIFMINDKTAEKSTGEKKIAYLPTLGITIYSYVDWYAEIGTNKETSILEDGDLILFKKGSFRCQYGALALRAKQGEPAKRFVEKEVLRVRYPENSEDDVLEYLSAPLISPEDAQGWLYAQVI